MHNPFDEVMKHRERQRDLDHERELDRIRSGQDGLVNKKIVWHGTDRQFVACMIDLRERKHIEADNDTDLIRQACEHFRRKDGTAWTSPRTMLQNFKNSKG